MVWNDLHEPIPSQRNELLARVVRRGERLRQRRRVVLGAATLSAVLVVAIPVAVWSGTTGSPTRAVSASGGQAGPDAFADSGAPLDATTTVPPADSVAPHGDATASASPPTTGLRSTATTSSPAASGTAAVTPAPPPSPAANGDQPGGEQRPRCTAADLEVTGTTDKATYAPGEVIRITPMLRNRSSQTCAYAETLTLVVRDAAGTMVYGPVMGHADYLARSAPTLAPGQSAPTLATQWDQQICAGMNGCSPAPPGDYTAFLDVGYGAVTVPVTIQPV